MNTWLYILFEFRASRIRGEKTKVEEYLAFGSSSRPVGECWGRRNSKNNVDRERKYKTLIISKNCVCAPITEQLLISVCHAITGTWIPQKVRL